MRRDRRPYFIRRIIDGWTRFQVQHFIVPAFDAVGPGLDITSPRNLEIWGGGIRAGSHLHLHAAEGNLVRLATWRTGDREGRITIGDYVLISPGTHIVASDEITIGSNTMIASGCYISDSDWHDTYDRTAELDKHRPIRIGENVWLGVRAIIGKGVTIGDNSIIGAGAVVTRDIPANCIAAGNPARVVRELDPARDFRKREVLFADNNLERDMDRLMRYMLRENTLFGWLRSVFSPSRMD
ncbi:transferase hexapeptide repeat containing protein [Parvibaculum lavamentivorans DS-1]|uniref:Transferase hexapeptide repeat containing protein n=1 Tax=Parvibaculum lavamentivorans (strain DS-1 / DSM 13023 / NCIMB 13966) TaxID=402881 RepID=A7HXR9_PARL1|nr:acyltransferase [Parvibaculum lavamentivorans]ABS64702.1 transferase hexapeptide repeat containing protein [Parvibaculum lavamentivorans DS-1]